jgi:hypothetical protein
MFYRAGISSVARAYTKDGRPGRLATSVTGVHGTTGAYEAQTTLPGDVNGDGRVDFADEKLFVAAYGSRRGDPNYNPAADFNGNGFVGQGDAKLLLRNLTPLAPKLPLSVDLHLAPSDQVRFHPSKNSGGETLKKTVTIVGHTTPAALVFSDSSKADFTFAGPATVADARGFFSFKVSNKDGVNNNEFLVIDPFGQQTIRAFPIFWIPFAAGLISTK